MIYTCKEPSEEKGVSVASIAITPSIAARSTTQMRTFKGPLQFGGGSLSQVLALHLCDLLHFEVMEPAESEVATSTSFWS